MNRQTPPPQPPDRLTVYYRLSGKVQGVCFRIHTQENAKQLGLVGWVRNCVNGDVEAVAQGSVQAITKFEQWLHHGPEQAIVEKLNKKPHEAIDLKQFEIRH